MLHKKACPRCRGDLTLVRDVDETYFSCVQCGYVCYGWPETLRPAAPEPAPARSR